MPENGDGSNGDGGQTGGTGDSGGTGDGGQPQSRKPEFQGDFDPERAARLIENLRTEVADLKKAKAAPEPRKTKEHDDDPRYTELMTRLTAAEQRDQERAAKELRGRVSESTGVPADLLVGDDEDALTKHAQALAKWAAEQNESPVRGRPRARLVPGTGSRDGGDEGFDPVKVAEAAHR